MLTFQKAQVAILIFYKVDFRAKKITGGDKWFLVDFHCKALISCV